MPEPAWEAWLGQRFPGYLLYSAAGEPRPVQDVDRALGRLADSPGALARLATLGFLLDPGGGTERLVCETIPAYLRRVHPVSYRETQERQGSFRGGLDWGRTLALRQRTRDATWFVTSTPRRTFGTPGLMLVRWLLDRVVAGVDALAPRKLEERAGWAATLSEMHGSASRCLGHAALRDLPASRPSPHQRTHLRQDRDAAIREAARVATHHGDLLPEPQPEALRETVSRFSLVPLDVETRFELFVLLSVMEIVNARFPGVPRRDDLISDRRDVVASWHLPHGSLEARYDQAAEPAQHAAVMRHYFPERQHHVRPDVRLTWSTGGRTVDLYLDAKLSMEPSYLAGSQLKMRGYIADRPDAFAASGPRVVLVCPGPVAGAPRETDQVVFVGSESCGPGGHLACVVEAWLSQVGVS